MVGIYNLFVFCLGGVGKSRKTPARALRQPVSSTAIPSHLNGDNILQSSGGQVHHQKAMSQYLSEVTQKRPELKPKVMEIGRAHV